VPNPTVKNYSQIPPGSTGDRIGEIEVTALIDGVQTTIRLQAVAIADQYGNVINSFADYNWQEEMLAEARRQTRMLGILLEHEGLLPEELADALTGEDE
jgi:hypothetical protein